MQRGFDLPVKERKPGNYPLVTSSGPTDFHSEARVRGPGVVTGRSGSIGNVFYVEDSFWPLNTALYVKDFHGNDPRYIFYLLQFFDLGRFASGAGVPTLNRNHVHDEAVWIATDLDEQKRIVAVLDQAFAALDRARALAEANLADAEELFEAQLDAALGQADGEWISATLDSLCSKIGSGATPKGGSASYRSEGISLIRSLNVYDREFREDKLAFIGEEQARKLDIVTVKEGDVLFNITGASVARCCIAPTHLLPARVNQHVAILRPDRSRLMPDFLCLLLTTRTMKDRLLKVGNEGGATRQAITKAQLQALTVSFPSSLEEQCDIIDDLKHQSDQCLSLRSTYQKTIIDLADLRQSFLHKAFTGELT